MKVAIVRGGGVAGIATATRLDAAALVPPQAAELEAKVREAGLLKPPAAAPSSPPPHPDDLLYEVSVEDGGEEHRHRYRDSELPDSVRSLVEWVGSRPESETSIASA
jgi:flavin-dependent dehydrogenase